MPYQIHIIPLLQYSLLFYGIIVNDFHARRAHTTPAIELKIRNKKYEIRNRTIRKTRNPKFEIRNKTKGKMKKQSEPIGKKLQTIEENRKQ